MLTLFTIYSLGTGLLDIVENTRGSSWSMQLCFPLPLRRNKNMWKTMLLCRCPITPMINCLIIPALQVFVFNILPPPFSTQLRSAKEASLSLLIRDEKSIESKEVRLPNPSYIVILSHQGEGNKINLLFSSSSSKKRNALLGTHHNVNIFQRRLLHCSGVTIGLNPHWVGITP